MNLEIAYTFSYIATLKRIHWRVASDLDAALLRFAARAEHLHLPSGRYAVRAEGDANGYEILVLVSRVRGTILAESAYRIGRR
jgi:hypothetical protein